MSVERCKKDLAVTFATAEKCFAETLEQIEAAARQAREHMRRCPDGITCDRLPVVASKLMSLTHGLPLDLMSARLAAKATGALVAPPGSGEQPEPAKTKGTVH